MRRQEFERSIARAALEAAERVRPRRKDSTSTERSRRFRSKRNGVAVSGGNGVADNSGNGVAGADSLTPLSLLLARKHAAGGNVAPGAVDVAPIQVLLAAGCDLDLDVLPVIREIAKSQTPIKRWDHPGLIRAVLRGRDIRIAPKCHRRARPPASTRLAFRASTWTSSSPATGPATW